MLLNFKRLIPIAFCLFMFSSAQAADYRVGEQYSLQGNPVAAAPAVVEFFSFYCGTCYQFSQNYHVGSAVSKALPTGTSLTRYHVSQMGKLGNELTEAWAVATVLGVEDKIEGALFKALQKQRAINSSEDIQRVFTAAGIDAATYENTRQSMPVKGLIAKQNEAVNAFDVRGTPSFYVAGKYKIENTGIASTSVEGYVKEYAAVVRYLLDTQP